MNKRHNYAQNNASILRWQDARAPTAPPDPLRGVRLFPIQNKHFADVLDRLGLQPCADFRKSRFAGVALEAGGPDLDQFVHGQGAANLGDDCFGQAFAAQVNDRVERVGARLQRLAFRRGHIAGTRRNGPFRVIVIEDASLHLLNPSIRCALLVPPPITYANTSPQGKLSRVRAGPNGIFAKTTDFLILDELKEELQT